MQLRYLLLIFVFTIVLANAETQGLFKRDTDAEPQGAYKRDADAEPQLSYKRDADAEPQDFWK
ncbi:kinase-like domain-containing protein [Rhizophagus irregularis DAOM 181602=DAOM 197198]|uniref:Uncharacterized protein n=1 Tax=Rhizophagus irregularis (strain DAOM 181602 / DAOM 197198 / MUCL 43194) TaxID=747089 RepID=U9TF74_RHIID|nr:kinase-like domain-containing protein [Rhizophagus irregularis DAOM 181602=DAOM 197198]CAG8662140.1 13335_t:CDS:2 [Rhizophagus irregularis]